MTARKLVFITPFLLLGTALPAAAQAIDPLPVEAIVTAGPLAFPSGLAGTHGSALDQVDEVVAAAERRLKTQGLGLGDMMQHTIYLKDGAASPIDVLNRFHADARKLAPSLVARSSVGTIIRVPGFADPRTLVAFDLTASSAHQADLARVPFTFGPQEISETIGNGDLIFTAGCEGYDFEHNTLKPTIDEQIDTIVGKLDAAMRHAGLTLGNMVSHNLYVTRGTDPIHVIEAFHRAARRVAPELAQSPSVGTLVVVDGMAMPGFLLEVDAVASRRAPDTLHRVPFTEMPMDIAKSVATDRFIYAAGMEGVDFAKGNRVSPDVREQARVAAGKLADALKGQGARLSDVVKYMLYVKGADKVPEARAAFHRALLAIDPAVRAHRPAETVVVVEGLAGPQLDFEVSAIAAR
jgi:enamine deaminase RidA (YjgF/YER057c/UK114 family)